MTAVVQKENGGVSLQVGCGYVKEKNARKGEKKMFDAKGMLIKHKLAEFRVTENGVLPVMWHHLISTVSFLFRLERN